MNFEFLNRIGSNELETNQSHTDQKKKKMEDVQHENEPSQDDVDDLSKSIQKIQFKSRNNPFSTALQRQKSCRSSRTRMKRRSRVDGIHPDPREKKSKLRELLIENETRRTAEDGEDRALLKATEGTDRTTLNELEGLLLRKIRSMSLEDCTARDIDSVEEFLMDGNSIFLLFSSELGWVFSHQSTIDQFRKFRLTMWQHLQEGGIEAVQELFH